MFSPYFFLSLFSDGSSVPIKFPNDGFRDRAALKRCSRGKNVVRISQRSPMCKLSVFLSVYRFLSFSPSVPLSIGLSVSVSLMPCHDQSGVFQQTHKPKCNNRIILAPNNNTTASGKVIRKQKKQFAVQHNKPKPNSVVTSK